MSKSLKTKSSLINKWQTMCVITMARSPFVTSVTLCQLCFKQSPKQPNQWFTSLKSTSIDDELLTELAASLEIQIHGIQFIAFSRLHPLPYTSCADPCQRSYFLCKMYRLVPTSIINTVSMNLNDDWSITAYRTFCKSTAMR